MGRQIRIVAAGVAGGEVELWHEDGEQVRFDLDGIVGRFDL